MIEPGQKGKICPLCGTPSLKRIRRIGEHKILKLIPFSKLYECRDCYNFLLFILGRLVRNWM